MVKVSFPAILLLWTFTIFLGMFWYYLPAFYGYYGDIFLALALICGAISFRVTITRKF